MKVTGNIKRVNKKTQYFVLFYYVHTTYDKFKATRIYNAIMPSMIRFPKSGPLPEVRELPAQV